jgi:alpha-L-rhamnosidase
LDENGECPIGDDGTDIMISYNHYASGAVGDFLYRRVIGLEAQEPGYRRFTVKPVLGGDLNWAKSHVESPYGRIEVRWEIAKDEFCIHLTVPMGTECCLNLPDGTVETLGSGTFVKNCRWNGKGE